LYPNQTSPINIISSPVQCDVQSVKVASLPPEEFGYVDGLEENVSYMARAYPLSSPGN
jgi:hypothetical protein